MGDYADMHIDSEFNSWFDRVYGRSNNSSYDDELIDDWDESDLEVPNFVHKLKKYGCYEFEEVLTETEKSYLVKMEKSKKFFWISKKHSRIKGDFIFIEKWYAKKLKSIPHK